MTNLFESLQELIKEIKDKCKKHADSFYSFAIKKGANQVDANVDNEEFQSSDDDTVESEVSYDTDAESDGYDNDSVDDDKIDDRNNDEDSANYDSTPEKIKKKKKSKEKLINHDIDNNNMVVVDKEDSNMDNMNDGNKDDVSDRVGVGSVTGKIKKRKGDTLSTNTPNSTEKNKNNTNKATVVVQKNNSTTTYNGVRGLTNPNKYLCYMNSLIQCLTRVYPGFTHYWVSNQYKEDVKDEATLSPAFSHLIKTLGTKNYLKIK